MSKALEWIIDKLARERHDITRPGMPTYLTRWVLWGSRNGDGQKAFLHCFHRGDPDTPHDHPWPFVTIILKGGYTEETLNPDGRLTQMWCSPGMILYRPAKYAHRIILPKGKTCWTLVIPGKKERSWGFHCKTGWIHWSQFQKSLDAGGNGCE